MDHIVAVAVLDGLQELVDIVAHVIQLQTVGVLLKDFKEVLLQVLED